MGGDKHLRVLLGQTLLDRAVGLVSPLCAEVLVVGLSDLPDSSPGLGPLGGLLTGLERASFELVLVVTVDMPALDPGVLAALVAARQDGDRVALVADPFPGLYHREVASTLRSYLAEGRRRAREFAASLSPRLVQLPPEFQAGLDCNVNTPEDLARAERLLQG